MSSAGDDAGVRAWRRLPAAVDGVAGVVGIASLVVFAFNRSWLFLVVGLWLISTAALSLAHRRTEADRDERASSRYGRYLRWMSNLSPRARASVFALLMGAWFMAFGLLMDGLSGLVTALVLAPLVGVLYYVLEQRRTHATDG